MLFTNVYTSFTITLSTLLLFTATFDGNKLINMKKYILLLIGVAAIYSLTACGQIKGTEVDSTIGEATLTNEFTAEKIEKEVIKKKIFEDFIYDVGPRFGGIKKGVVDNATTFESFYNEEQLEKIEELKSVTVIVVINDERSDIRETGITKELNKAQLKLLQSSAYSTNFIVKAEYLFKNKKTGELEESSATPHLTIVPEKQATYSEGIKALKKYFKTNTEEVRKEVDPEKLRPAKLYFTVTKNGTIENVNLDRESGYPRVDETMIILINELPGKWTPAENLKGEKVNQELVVSFGLMGC